MPYSKNYKKRSYKKRSRKRRYRNLKSPISRKLITKLRYSERVSLTAQAAGAVANWRFGANCCYDPNLTGSGHQPRGFDELMALYHHYTVIGSKITVRFAPDDSMHDSMVGITLNGNSGYTSTLLGDYAENSSVKSAVLPNGANSSRTMSYTYSPKRFHSISKPLSDDSLKGTTSANPTEQAGFMVWMANLDSGSSSGAQVHCLVTIDYIVALTEPKEVNGS